MDNEYTNSEGYADETPFLATHALRAEERRRAKLARRPLVYVCSPYAGDVEGNVAAARRYSRFAAMRGAIPVTPHLLYPQFMDDGNPDERALALKFGQVLLDKCSELWSFGARVSSGMEAEIARARRRGMEVRYFTDDLKEAH